MRIDFFKMMIQKRQSKISFTIEIAYLKVLEIYFFLNIYKSQYFLINFVKQNIFKLISHEKLNVS